MKLHSFRQDLQDYQDFFGLVSLYPVHPACQGEAPPGRGKDWLILSKNGKFMPLSFLSGQTGRFGGQWRRWHQTPGNLFIPDTFSLLPTCS
jgi:hypothetical protein